jgi:hypothetical protein
MQFAKREKISPELLALTVEERKALFAQKHLEELVKEYQLYRKPLDNIEAISERLVQTSLLRKRDPASKSAAIAKTMRALGFQESLVNLKAWLRGEHPQDKINQLEI